MNFLGHCLVAQKESPEFRFGSMAPDFVGMVGSRINPDHIPNPEIVAGVTYHYQVDAVFDKNPTVLHLKQLFRNHVAPQFLGENTNPIRVVNEIGQELLLDGYILKTRPNIIIDFWSALGFVEDEHIQSCARDNIALVGLVRRFETSIPPYWEHESVANMIFRRVQTRPKLKFDPKLIPQVTQALSQQRGYIDAFGGKLLKEMSETLNLHKL